MRGRDDEALDCPQRRGLRLGGRVECVYAHCAHRRGVRESVPGGGGSVHGGGESVPGGGGSVHGGGGSGDVPEMVTCCCLDQHSDLGEE